jgi:hypothetical protein
MKKLLIHAFALITALLPLQLTQAAPQPPAVYGGFEVGKTFTYRVTSVFSYTNQGGVNVAVPIPKGLPVYTLGQEVTFTIGKKGELIAPGVKIPFMSDGGTSNTYLKNPKKGKAIVFKSFSTNEPLNITLDYQVFKKSKTGSGITWVVYMFNP